MAELIGTMLGHQVTYVPVSEQDRRDTLRAAGFTEWYVDLLVSLETGAESGQIGEVNPSLKHLLGREPRTVEEFLAEKIGLFTK